MSPARQMRAARAKRGDRETPAEEGEPQESLSKGSYAQVLELEQRLLTTIQAKGPFDPNVRILRSNIRELFEAIILDDHEFAESHDVEQSLWRLHHTCIEEFRVRIRKSMPPAGTATSGNKSATRREPVQKILAVFRSYLAEATGFYHDLILKIGARHGLSQDDLTYSTVIANNTTKDDKRIAEIRRCQLSSHRCLIYLGDLARYKEYYGDGDTKNHDWSIAAGFYVKAASMWPASGNPYNQLAVLATYIGDEMLAVYHYFRSLASENPFFTAKDNLVLLFEKNRHSYLRLFASSAGNSMQTARLERAGKGQLKEETQVSQEIGSEGFNEGGHKASSTDIMKNFRICFVRLNGILFTRTSLEAFSEVHSCVLTDLKELLKMKETDDVETPSLCSLTSGRNSGIGPNVILQLISILIFSVYNVNMGSGPESHQPTYAEILQRSVVLSHAFIALFEYVGFILQHCSKLDEPSNSLFLPAIVVVMEWLSCRPEITVGSDVKEKEGIARMFFWKNCVDFLNRFGRVDLGRVDPDGISEKGTLWEDFELWGFIPLLPVQQKLDYAKKPDVGSGSPRDRYVRLKRLKHAGKVIADMFDGSDKGIHYDVEIDAFYLVGEKKLQERKQVDTIAASADTLKALPVRSVADSKFKQVQELKSTSPKATFPVDEEDEEVIVFKPSSKLKDMRLPASISKPLIQEEPNISSDSIVTSSQLDASVGSSSTPVMESVVHAMVSPSAVPSVSDSVFLSSSRQNLMPKSAGLAAQVSGPLNDICSFQAVKTAGMNPNLDHSYLIQGPSLDSLGLLDKDCRAPGSQFEPGRLSGNFGSTVDWGGGTSFSMVPSRIPSFANWLPQDGIGNNSLWSSELHKLRSAIGPFGIQGGSNLAMAERFPFLDPSLVSRPSMALTSAAQSLSESSSVPTYAMEPHVSDALEPSKLRVQEPLSVTTDNYIRPNLGTTSGNDKPASKVATMSSNMRPPPGFGPLPAKPPASLSATSAFQASQPTSSAFSTAAASLQQISVLDQSGPLSVEEHVDDYAWLDGYTPPKKETGQSYMLGPGSRVMGNSNYGWLSSGFNPALDATASPFPGMKTMDRFLSPPPFPAPPQQPPLSSALQQELFKQQTQEQYQQHLLQEQRLQHLYNAQFASQWNQMQQDEQRPPPPSPNEPSRALQPQMPQSLWPGQNSFVS